jgi:hypothetical protein
MEEIININGVEYIKRESINEMENELANLRSIIGKINQLTNTENAPAAPKKVKINVNDDDIFKVPLTAQELWEITSMNRDGEFLTKNNRKLKITIKEVFIAQKELSRNTTVGEAKELRKKLDINRYTFNRLVFNIQNGVFSKFIQQWNRQTQPVVSRKKVPFENNVEKRKEKGYLMG